MCLKLRFLSSRGLQLLEDAKRQQEAIQMKKAPCTCVQSAFELVGPAGVEPTTNGLKVRCSTN